MVIYFLFKEHVAHSNETNEQECCKYWRHNDDWNHFKHQGLFVFLFSPLKLHFSRTVDYIIARGAFLESLEYYISCPGSIRHTSMDLTNRSVAEIKDKMMTEKVQTSETSGVCVISSDNSLLDNRWWDHRKRRIFGNLRVWYVCIWKFMCGTNCQHKRQLVKSWWHNTDKNENQTSFFEKYNQIKV